MLKQLHVKNFTLIDQLDIDLHQGFSVITGETGAGKSIILGALHLLLGQRADCKQIKAGKDKCVVEAHFDLSNYDMESFFNENYIDFEPQDCIVRREVNSNGKSRAFINDTPVSLNTKDSLSSLARRALARASFSERYTSCWGNGQTASRSRPAKTNVW